MQARIINQSTIEINDLSQFDIEAILHSGQIFRYFELDDGYLVLSAGHWALVKAKANLVSIECDDANYFYQYFDLDTDYTAIKKTLAFPKLQGALTTGGGIRILRADFIEMVISFIISANNNIKRFTKTLNLLAEKFGNLIAHGQFSFPTLAQLSQVSVEDFRALGCGYRAPYLVKAVQQLKQLDYNELNALTNHDLRQRLLQIVGVGPKVAACIMLFAFHRLDVAPVDTWIKKAIEQMTADEQNSILHGPYAGVAQQYIFFHLQYLHNNLNE